MDLAELHLHWGTRNYKENTYRSYSLARAYRKDGKNCKEIVLKLGKLTDEQATRWRDVLKVIKKQNTFLATLDDLVVTMRFAYLDVAVANHVWNDWDLDAAFARDDEKKSSCAIIARILTLNRCIDPATKSQTPKWFRRTALPWILDIDPEFINVSRIFRELDVIEECKESLCKHMYERLREQDLNGMKSVFYDLSSTKFYGSRCALMKWGHCKEGYYNHVVLALVVNRDGVPFYWEVLQGGTADAKTIAWLLKRLKSRFNVTGTTLIFDRGMVSNDNLASLENERIKYISAMDRNQLETITGIDFTAFSGIGTEHVEFQADKLPEFAEFDKNTYYREVNAKGDRRYILCFNYKLFKDQRKARLQAVEDFRSFTEEVNQELSKAEKARQEKPTYDKFKQKIIKLKLADFVDIDLQVKCIKSKTADDTERDVRTYTGTVVVDDTKMLYDGRLDGFWLLVTNHNDKEGGIYYDMPVQDVIAPYRDKAVIESSFRDIKSFIEVAPVHVWTKDHVKAHYTVCVLSHVINRTLALRLHKNPGTLTKDIVSHERLYAELSDCMIDCINVENVNMSTYNMTRPTNDKKELLARVGSENLLSSNVVKKAREHSL